jgi:hypothetical protein
LLLELVPVDDVLPDVVPVFDVVPLDVPELLVLPVDVVPKEDDVDAVVVGGTPQFEALYVITPNDLIKVSSYPRIPTKGY